MKCEAWKGKSKIGNLLYRVWRDLSKKVGGMLNVVQHLHCARCLGQIIIVNRKWRNFDCLALEFSHSHSFDANLIHAQAIYHFLLRCTNVLLSFTQMKQLHCHRVGENSTIKPFKECETMTVSFLYPTIFYSHVCRKVVRFILLLRYRGACKGGKSPKLGWDWDPAWSSFDNKRWPLQGNGWIWEAQFLLFNPY